MDNPKILIEFINMDMLNITLKGGRHEVIKMIVEAMERAPEVKEAIIISCKAFLDKNKFRFEA